MEIRTASQHIELRALEPFAAEMLRRLVPSGAADDPKVRTRLFPSPTGGDDESADGEWRELIEPGLEALFQSTRETIAHDLADLPDGAPFEDYAVRIPVAHLEAWLNGLNQARLALNEQHRLGERNLSGHHLPTKPDRRMALAQCEFYGMLMELFLRVIDRNER